MNSSTYKAAGVDLDLYAQSMEKLPALIRRTHAAQKGKVLDLPGGFAGLFRLFGDGQKWKDPVLVSGADGVGTKIKVAQYANVYETIGIDLVGMCVNDCLCLGAQPLFFLDYLAFAKDDPEQVEALVRGVSNGCLQAGAALIGGETAIMPGLYQPGDFDMAGFCVGVVDRSEMIDGSAIQAGDQIISIPSNGFHSNGYSLIRHLVFEQAKMTIDQPIPELNNQTVKDVLLTPTKIYADIVAKMMDWQQTETEPGNRAITGIAHITGGGLQENVDRVLPDGHHAEIDRTAWTVPAEFQWLQKLGSVDTEEMFRVFNMGIGLTVITRKEKTEQLCKLIAPLEPNVKVIGEVKITK